MSTIKGKAVPIAIELVIYGLHFEKISKKIVHS